MHEFYIPAAHGKNKTFALPTMFGEEFPYPNWDKEVIFLPGKIDTNRRYKPFLPAIANFLAHRPIEGCSEAFFKKTFAGLLQFGPHIKLYEKKPYDQVMEGLGHSKLSLPILNPGAIIEACFMGTPSIFWEEGGFYNPLAKNLGVLIPSDAEPGQFTSIAEEMVNNKKRHWEVTRVTQDYFSCHLYRNAIEYFNFMIANIF